ncbi:hypothetical protein OS493_004692 [Desmophyllum pertusum]|uniref:G-protein coupled receptors family 1 profile domain-containing protein n=1 Tax=Desmophyllum pertusum TaxID=174260 RepID=A0A9W9ZHJ3_9CNID|nr:hypothetical protein OS493_004692 [Desmophyllum pertusum]
MNNSSNHSLPTWEMWIWSTSFLLESTAIILANSITCHIFWNQKRTLRQTSYVMINLALADLSVGLSVMCFSVENLVSSYTGEKPTTVGCLTADFFSEMVTWLPMVAALLFRYVCKNCLSLNNSIRAVYMGRILQYGNSLLNPVVYSVKMPEFKAKLVELLCRHQPRSSRTFDSSTSRTYPNFALTSATPILLSLKSLTSSSGRINPTNQEH